MDTAYIVKIIKLAAVNFVEIVLSVLENIKRIISACDLMRFAAVYRN